MKTDNTFNDAPQHYGLEFANTVSRFMPTDTEECFNNLCKTPEYLKYFQDHGWTDPDAITYKINSHGFRCDEFELNSDCIIALGCSFTMGIGLPIESTWPTLVGTALNKKVYNLSWGGASIDTCFRWANYWIPKLKPAAVFLLAPPPQRFELIMHNRIEVFLPSEEMPQQNQLYASFVKEWFANEENGKLNQRRNKLAILGMCSELNIPCQIYDSHKYMARSRDEVGYARDRMHAGPKGHKHLAEKIIDDWWKKHA